MNMKRFPLYGIAGRKGWAYWVLLFYGLLFVASLIASYIRNEEPVIPAFAFYIPAFLLWACMPVAVVIDEENGRLRWIVGFGRILTGGKPLTEYVRAERDETHARKVKLLSKKTHTFVELYQPEAFCEEMNKAIENNRQD
ncbi:hypothetical protein HQ40_09325 [Porphyromonas gulae]|nr:hypothetical protein HQ40_09325 [Porphyromonas gulae]